MGGQKILRVLACIRKAVEKKHDVEKKIKAAVYLTKAKKNISGNSAPRRHTYFFIYLIS